MIDHSPIIYFLCAILAPFIGLALNYFCFKKSPAQGARIATLMTWAGFLGTMTAWTMGVPAIITQQADGFLADGISWVIATLILFVSGIVHQFSLNYLAGSRKYRTYYLLLGLITITTLLMIAADNVIILIITWSASNLLLVSLMIHKANWKAARNSGIIALKTFAWGFLFLSMGLLLLVYATETISIHNILKESSELSDSTKIIAATLIMIAALSQSGCWPFHGWLISSLNSPTTVSALMHAGLINGGGFLCARFAPLILNGNSVLNFLFLFACINLILGGVWKLLQPNIKRMLACSTMTQMGFMMMQCSLGLFPAALAHLCWHGLFKAFLFLNSGSSAKDDFPLNQKKHSPLLSPLPILCGFTGAIGFLRGSGLNLSFTDTTLFLVLFSWLASAQFSHTLLEKSRNLPKVVMVCVLCFGAGILYGFAVNLIEKTVLALHIWQPQPLNGLHFFGLLLLSSIWIGINSKFFAIIEESLWWRRAYVTLLNASQPKPETISSHRNNYQF